jgi:hypothetical protein
MTSLGQDVDGSPEQPMRRYERWALVVAFVAVLSQLLQLAMSIASASDAWRHSWWWIMLATTTAGLLTRLAVGLWLYYTAQRDGHSPMVWAAFGVVFSLLAAILYFLLRVLASDPRSAPAREASG